jgi:hypothetical protein
MDDLRYQELMDKRDRVGLSNEEASELGRMIAERMGKPYRGPEDLHPHHAAPNGQTPGGRKRATERTS